MEYQKEEIDKILNSLHSLEIRISRLETALNVADDRSLCETGEQFQQKEQSPKVITEDDEKGLESQIGRFGLAWLGNIVLFFGIAFLTQYMIELDHKFFSLLLGYLASGAIFLLALYLKKSNDHLSSIFRMNSQVLLFYFTVRLHFFSGSPLIHSKTFSVAILLFLVILQIYMSIRDESQPLAALALFFALTVAILADTTNLTLSIVVFIALMTVYLYYRFTWEPLLVVTIFLCYIVFLLWLFGNPFFGHPFQMITEHHQGGLYLLGLGASFSLISLFRKKDSVSDDFLISILVINGILFTILLLLIVLRFFTTNYIAFFTIITLCSLIYSVILHSRSDWNFGSAFYALYGFTAMSIALFGIFGLPRVYLLLSLQSLLVVSMALWFRNRLIIVMNSLLFLTILLIYLFSSRYISGVNFSFAFIALISARIINWKKSRLNIRTDIIRNLYMIEGFFMMLLALLLAVPKQFVTFSWTMAALLYFIISLLLKNIKYRYMALATMICSAFYLFIIDLARIELIYRVLALLFLAVISIGISIYYTNRVKK